MANLSRAARAAKEIRAFLKREYPQTIFSVTTKNYAGGDSITISYENGPEAKVIEEITECWSLGDFDGMDDSYRYKKEADRMTYYTHYIFVERKSTENEISENIVDVDIVDVEDSESEFTFESDSENDVEDSNVVDFPVECSSETNPEINSDNITIDSELYEVLQYLVNKHSKFDVESELVFIQSQNELVAK